MTCKRVIVRSFFFLFAIVLSACETATPTAESQIVTIYASSAAEPWLSELFICANDLSVVLKVSAASPDIYLRVGEPEILISPAYQIDEEEILVVAHRESAVQNLSLAEVQELFANPNPSIQVWVYASDADIQILFDQLAMQGRSVNSFARVAVNPQQMSDVLNSESNSVGILSRHWLVGNAREVFSAGVIPVLAIIKDNPHEIVNKLIGCLQKD